MLPLYYLHLFWAIYVFLAIVGWGSLAQLKFAAGTSINWGIKFCLGVGVVITIGGFLMPFSLATAPILSAVLFFGFIYWAYADAKRIRLTLRYKEDIVLWALVLFAFAASIAWPHNLDINDDYIVYLAWPDKLLQTGTLLEPFSVRRALSFGGQTLLQAFTFIGGDISSGHIVDSGYGALSILGVLFWLTRNTPAQRRWLRFSLLLFAVVLPVPRIHSGSHALGIAMLLALMAVFIEFRAVLNLKQLLLLALLLVGLGTLRSTFLVLGPAIIASLLLCEAVRDIKLWKRPVLQLLCVGAMTFALLLPWMLVQYKSSGNFIFPPQMGNANPNFVFGGSQEGKINDLYMAFNIVILPNIGILFVISLLPFFLAKHIRFLYVIPGFLVIGLVFLSCYKMAASNFFDIFRYIFPLLVFAIFWSLSGIITTAKASKGLVRWSACSIVVCFVLFALPILRNQYARIKTMPFEFGPSPLLERVTSMSDPYKLLQAQTPRGSTILTISDFQMVFDFKRNHILNADILGGAGPAPGFPIGEGKDALKRYLRSAGVEFIIAVDFNHAFNLYSRPMWKNYPRAEWYWKVKYAPIFLDLFDSIDAMAEASSTITIGNARLIKL